MLVVDREKGPHGTGEWTGLYRVYPEPQLFAPNIAESWEIDATNNLLKFKIRQGVRWHNKPPMNGGELTPQDVVYNYVYLWSHPRTVYTRSYAHIRDLKKPQNSIYLDPSDPRTVIFEAGSGELGNLWERISAYTPVHFGEAFGPLEKALETYGDWRGVVGPVR